jgi:hypothetical protein
LLCSTISQKKIVEKQGYENLNETLLKNRCFVRLEQAVVHKSTPQTLSEHLFSRGFQAVHRAGPRPF